MEKKQDQELISAIKRSDRRAFETFFRRHFKNIYQRIWQLVQNEEVARDLTQSTFVKLWEVRKTLDPQKYNRAFLQIMARNLTISWLRKPENRNFSLQSCDFLQEDYDDKEIELAHKLHQVIKELEEPLRVVLNLRLRGFKDKEIAEILGVSVATVDKRKTKAFRILRARLKDFWG